MLGLRILPHLVDKRGKAKKSNTASALSLKNLELLQELKKEASNTPSLDSNSKYPAIVDNPLLELHVTASSASAPHAPGELVYKFASPFKSEDFEKEAAAKPDNAFIIGVGSHSLFMKVGRRQFLEGTRVRQCRRWPVFINVDPANENVSTFINNESRCL